MPRADAEAETKELWDEVAFYKSNYLAINSVKTYFTGIRAYVIFMLKFGLLPLLPVTDDHLCAFIVYLSRSLTMSSIKTYLYGVRAWHLVHGTEFPVLSSRFSVFQTLQGVKRFVAKEAKPKMALTWDILSDLFPHVEDPWNDPAMCAMWACFLVAYFGMFRKDTVTIRKAGSFNPVSQLCRQDFRVEQRDDGQWVLWVRVRQAKNNQFKDRVHYVGMVHIPGTYMCPVMWWLRHLQLSPAGPTDPAFCFGKHATEMTHDMMVKGLKVLLDSAGLDSSLFSGHSFRRGGATDSFRMKAPHDMIQLQGDWLSTAYLQYNEKDQAYRLQLPSMLASLVAADDGVTWMPPGALHWSNGELRWEPPK